VQRQLRGLPIRRLVIALYDGAVLRSISSSEVLWKVLGHELESRRVCQCHWAPAGWLIRNDSMKQINFFRGGRRDTLIIFSLIPGLLLLSPASRAVPPPAGVAPVLSPAGGLSIDGNLIANTPITGIGDWMLSTNASGAGGAVLGPTGAALNGSTTFHLIDAYNSSSDLTFAGGLKWTDNPNLWKWKTGKPSTKTDINNALVHVGNDIDGHSWVIVAADRLSNNGDSYIDFEFLQNTLIRTTTNTFVSAGPHGGRTVGDLLLSLVFSGGGDVADFFVWRWQPDGSGGFVYVDSTASFPSNRVFAALNSNTIAAPYGAFGGNTYIPNAFAEAAVDLTALVGNFDPCLSLGFKTIMIKTKTSTSDTSSIEDFMDPIQYSFNVGPSVNAGAAQTRCTEGDSTAFALHGTATAGLHPLASTNWTVVNGTAIIDSPTSLDTTAHVFSATATLRLTAIESTGCTETNDIVLTVSPLPPCSITGAATVCPRSSTQFRGPPGMSSYLWSIAGNGALSGSTNLQTVSAIAGSACGTNLTLILTVISNNCSSQCAMDVMVNDTTPPILTCPADRVLECTVSPTTNNTGSATATDACSGIASITFTDAFDVANCTGKATILRTWTATDGCGNSASCLQTISFKDTVPPLIICPTNITLECTVPTTTDNTGVATATDTCGGVTNISYVDAFATTNCTGKATILRTWTARDTCGNSNGCIQTISFKDTVPPAIVCPPDITLECTATPTTNVTGIATATDTCSSVTNISFVDKFTTANCTGKGAILRTWSARDACGNSNGCVQTISFKDTVPPVIVCPPDITIECTLAPTTNLTGVATASDTCSAVTNISFADSFATTNCTGKAAILRTWSARDACGNSNGCVQTITFKDTVAPVIVCPPNITIECTLAPTTNLTGLATATDTCSAITNISFADAFATTNCTGKAAILRTWTARDACGNSNGCIQTISFKDTVPPVVVCPPDITLECTVAPTTSVTGMATATDTCSSVTNISFVDKFTTTNCTGKGAILRTWSARDACGNSNSCVQTITFKDTVPPMIICPLDITLECTVAPTTNITGVATATDTCSAVTNISFVDTLANTNCTGKGMILRTWSARDACGNSNGCVQTISFKDTVPPVIHCPADITIECTVAPTTNVTGMATATDTCSAVTSISFADAFATTNCTGKGMILRTWTARDACGNSNGCVQTISFKDTVPPIVVCPADITLECTLTPTTNLTGVPTVTDTCSAVTNISYVDVLASTNCTGKAMILRTWSARDACGNSNGCVQTINFKDTVPPVITCPPNITLECTTLPTTNITGVATATESCSAVTTMSFVDVLATTNCTGKPTILRTWIARDACGNSNGCVQTISFKDTVPPVITCPLDITLECTVTPTTNITGAATATDTCSAVTNISFVDRYIQNNCSGKGTLLRTWIARDACGNSNGCVQTITFKDTVPPVIHCPVDITLECTVSPTPANAGMATATDTCSAIASITFADAFTTTNCTGKGTILRTWTARDSCGNSNSCVQTIMFADTTKPTMSCPAVSVQCVGDVPAAYANLSAFLAAGGRAADTCSPTLTFAQISDSGVVGSCPGRVTRVYRVTDVCGNFAECTQTITVNDTIAPVLTCPAGLTVECGNSLDPANIGSATATDNCSTNVLIAHSDAVVEENYNLNFYVADPDTGTGPYSPTYLELSPASLPCPESARLTGRALDPLRNAVAFAPSGQLDALTSIGSVPMALGQIVPYEVVIQASGGMGSERGTIEFTAAWNTYTTSNNRFGYDTNYMVYCAFVDAADPGSIDPNMNARVESYSSTVVNQGTIAEAIQGTFRVSGLDPGDQVVVEIWVVLMSTMPDHTGGTVAAGLVSAQKASIPPVPISIGTQTDSLGNLSKLFPLPPPQQQPPLGPLPQQPPTLPGVMVSVIDRTWTATDNCGNQSSCVQRITVRDTTPPALSKPSDLILELPADTTVAHTGMATAQDACGSAVVTYSDSVSNRCGGTKVITRTWTATDQGGNSTSAVQMITVADTTPPSIVCPPDSTVQAGTAWTFTPPAASDNSGVVTVQVLKTVTNVTSQTACSVTRTWLATDACGNTNTCQQTVAITSEAPPLLDLKWANSGTLMLTWTATGCQLESSDSLSSPNWGAMTVTPLINNGKNTVQFAPGPTRKFYRLRKVGP